MLANDQFSEFHEENIITNISFVVKTLSDLWLRLMIIQFNKSSVCHMSLPL